MSSPAGVRQRGGRPEKKTGTTTHVDDQSMNGKVEEIKKGAKEVVTREWDYKLGVTIITILAFVTRFWGISHPDQVVFDEVHFGKVCERMLYIRYCGFI